MEKLRSRKLSRRAFLKESAYWTGTLLLAQALNSSRGLEKLQLLPNNIAFVDFAPIFKNFDIEQPYYPSYAQMIERISGEEYEPLYDILAQALPHYFQNTYKEYPNIFSKVRQIELTGESLVDADAISGMSHSVGISFNDHGKKMIRTHKDILRYLGYLPEKNYIIPVQDAISAGNIDGDQFARDELGNSKLRVLVDENKIIESIQKYGMSQKIINFSFQVGYSDINFNAYGRDPKTNEPIMQLEPKITINGAYSADRAVENLSRLAKIAASFPDKLFVCAAGNYNDNFIEALKALEPQWPANIIICGQWAMNNKPSYGTYGADIYVTNDNMGFGIGSSTAANTISSIASILDSYGMSLEEIKAGIAQCCNTKEYTATNLQGEKPQLMAPVLSDLSPVRQLLARFQKNSLNQK